MDTQPNTPIEQRQPRNYLAIVNSWPFFFSYALASMLFAAAQIHYQRVLFDTSLRAAAVAGFAYTGATLVSLALLSSIVFKWKPRLAKYWRVRRFLGVSGTLYAACHALLVLATGYKFNFKLLFFSFNPIVNPVLFGVTALIILIIMTSISIDSIQTKLGRKWKQIQRLVYIAYPAIIFHYLLTNPASIRILPGKILVTLSALTLFGQAFWFFRIAGQKNFKTKASIVGFGVIILFTIIALIAFR